MSNGNYPVGYKKPPKHTRFKKGQSGNLRGRPKETDDKSFFELISDISKQGVSVKQGENTKVMQIREAVIHALVAQSLKGNVAASRIVCQLLEKSAPIEQFINPPVMIINPPAGPLSPEPPIYGEDDKEND